MGHGGRGYTSFSSTCTVSSPSVRDSRVGEFSGSRRSMASRHSRSSSCDSSASSSASRGTSAGYIEHPVSRFDTLAGVAIKYGVEVGDVKRMNGLVTDLQMFALKTLKIPLPGRHPPSASSNCAGCNSRAQPEPRLGKHPGLAHILKDSKAGRESERGPVTSAMGLLRGYYGLSTTPRQGMEGMEMAVYKSDSDYRSEDEPLSPRRMHEKPDLRFSIDDCLDELATSREQDTDSGDYPLEGRRSTGKSKAAVAPLDLSLKPSRSPTVRLETVGDGGGGENEKANDRLVRRRAKGEGLISQSSADFSLEMYTSPEAEITDRANAPLGKTSALRQKLPPTVDQEIDILPRPVVNSALNGWHTSSEGPGLAGNAVRALGSTILGGKTVEGIFSKVRRSASNPTLYEEKKSYRGDSSGIPMVSQGNAQSGVISSVLEGFPKPGGAVRRNKAAID